MREVRQNIQLRAAAPFEGKGLTSQPDSPPSYSPPHRPHCPPGEAPPTLALPAAALVLKTLLQLLSSDAPSRRHTGEAGSTNKARRDPPRSPTEGSPRRGGNGRSRRLGVDPCPAVLTGGGPGGSAPAPVPQHKGGGPEGRPGTRHSRSGSSPCRLPTGLAPSPVRGEPEPRTRKRRGQAPQTRRRCPRCQADPVPPRCGASAPRGGDVGCWGPRSPLEVAHQPAPRRGGHDGRKEKSPRPKRRRLPPPLAQTTRNGVFLRGGRAAPLGRPRRGRTREVCTSSGHPCAGRAPVLRLINTAQSPSPRSATVGAEPALQEPRSDPKSGI